MFGVALFVLLLCTAWFVVLAWKAFRVSCDARGGKAVAAFVIGIFVAEAVSKIAIWSMAAAVS